jgi:2-succinyl-5-enolpyruvyl-6-hydroxy-3-cyclohexene-1-carboxylate synthase
VVSVATGPSGAGDGDLQAAFATTLIDEWFRGGVLHAVVCPGSRSTPLAVALADHGGIAVHVRLDERSAAFTALGIGLATGRPAVVLTTSGTAAAELHAAVVEADLARVPLLAVTADRPPELRGVGAPQTIDQHRLFGAALRWFADPGVADAVNRPAWRSLGARSVVETTAGPAGPGPVHLNLPFREPLLGVPGPGQVPDGRPHGAPWHRVAVPGALPPTEVVDRLAEAGATGARGVVVVGAGGGEHGAVSALADALGWPVLADPRSGLRASPATVIAAADGILRSERFAAGHVPEVVLRLGGPWVSKVVTGFLASAAGAGAETILVDPWWQWADPERVATTVVRSEPDALCRAVVDRLADRLLEGEDPGPDTGWLRGWIDAEAAARHAAGDVLDGADRWSEPALARQLVATLPDGSALVVSSSMPVRDVEAFGAPRAGHPRVVANRGANGIDGVVSTALGVALAGPGPTVALVGDLAFLHDCSAMVGSPSSAVPCTVVVADNGGGGIFSFLPPAGALEPGTFETLFGTPQAPDVASVAAGFGLPVTDLGPDNGWGALTAAVTRGTASGGLSVIRVRLPDRAENVAVHGRVNRAVVEAVDALG